jgi:DNA polymerase V
MYALVDCNNFFVSCERAFQPELEGKPVVVLSNNDGCVVARSNESKAMGIKMCTPYFRIKGLSDSGTLIVRSSNYALYGDLSKRIMSILASSVPKLEIYSIDEAFMVISGITENEMIDMSGEIVGKIRKWVGVPVSIGIAETKTLAKIANHFAKKYPGYHGVCSVIDEKKRDRALALTGIGDVWGIGWRNAPKLAACGIMTASDFVSRPEAWVKRKMGVTGVRTWLELQGHDCLKENKIEKRKSICTSRSFAEMTGDEEELASRVADFAGMCARKLRSEHTVAYTVGVFIRTNRFRDDMEQYDSMASLRLEVPANSTQEIVSAALSVLRTLYRPEYKYKKAGVIVSDIVSDGVVQGAIFGFDAGTREKEDKLSELMDKINGSGTNILRLASQRPGHYSDGVRSEFRSKRFSTDWNELMEIH